jgi:zinc protease
MDERNGKVRKYRSNKNFLAWPEIVATTILALAALLLPGLASARLDLSAATVERLDNGLTVIVLEEPAFPLVSVQVVYRVGAKHEPVGGTGLAHFLEHMAFRSTENFPDTQVVSSIYAAGGEWHGYTWLDQTTYFATAPKDELDLLLSIEADRMVRVLIPEADVEAERGAVLTEMHGYENDPMTVLQDYVLYLSFLAHPYRNNTIGWESDVAGIQHAELVDFYTRHYHPGNAVLAVVGDVRVPEVLDQVRRHFGSLDGHAPSPRPRTAEPPQRGERRIRLQGQVQGKHFKIAWRAPSVHSPDFPAFLVLQELLSGGSGVSFLQNDWGTPARLASPLGQAADDIASWFPPAEEDYVFTVSGSLDADGDERALELAVQTAIASLQAEPGGSDPAQQQESLEALKQAKAAVTRALLFDVQTTEDAAHQLATFAGMDALEILTGLPAAVDGVRLEDVRRVATTWLGSGRRTIGWYVPDSPQGDAAPAAAAVELAAKPAGEPQPAHVAAASSAAGQAAAPGPELAGAPVVRTLDNGTVAIVQRSPLSATAHLKLVMAGAVQLDGTETGHNDPAWGVTSLDLELLPPDLDPALAGMAARLAQTVSANPDDASDTNDPQARLERHFRDILGLEATAASGRGVAGNAAAPLLVVVSGDVEPDAVLWGVAQAFGDLPPAGAGKSGGARARTDTAAPNESGRMEVASTLEQPVAQEQLGYVVPAPGPVEPAAAAWQMVLYVLTHGYEGRLGKEAISKRGLVYYIDSAYHSDGRRGWVTLSMGVDPGQLPAMRELLREELTRLLSEPPTQGDLDEARRHLLGRQLSGAQSNRVLASRLARDWLWYGELTTHEDLRKRLERVTLQDLLAVLPAFTAGAVVAVRNPSAEQDGVDH